MMWQDFPFADELTEELKAVDPRSVLPIPTSGLLGLDSLLFHWMDDREFLNQLVYYRSELKNKDEKNERLLSFKENRKRTRHHIKHGFSIGADTVVFITPQYGKFILGKGQKKLSQSSEKSKRLLLERIDASELVRIEDIILSPSNLDSLQADAFNDMSFLNDWVDERFKGLEMDMVPMDRARLDKLMAKYGSEHFVWTGALNYRERKPFPFLLCPYALVPPALPATLYYLIRPNYDSYYFCIGFNLKSGEPEIINYNNFKQRDARDMINSNVYDSLYQLKRSPKKKG